MKKNIERKDAEKNWNNPLKGLLLRKLFGTYEEYWKECERFNLLSDDQKHAYIEGATKTIKRVKMDNSLRRLKMVRG